MDVTHPSKHQKIAGVDRHADLNDVAAGKPDRFGNDVAGIDDGRSAENDHQLRQLVRRGEAATDRIGNLGHPMGDALFPLQQAARRPQPLRQYACRLLHDRSL